MSKSALYVVNTSNEVIDPSSIIPLGNTVRRFGSCIRQDGNSISATGSGYYLVTVSATVSPSAAGNVSIILNRDGVPIIGASSEGTASAAGDPVPLTINAIIRNVCDCDTSLLTVSLAGTSSNAVNIATTVTKL